jgi:hypothetical protein
MERGAGDKKEKHQDSLRNYEKIGALLAHTAEEIPMGHTVILHGAFRDLCGEYPKLFPEKGFGRYGGLVHSDSLRYALDTLQMSNLLYYGDFPEIVAHVKTDQLLRSSQKRAEKFVQAGLPHPDDWEPIGERFLELIEINKTKDTEELLVLRN